MRRIDRLRSTCLLTVAPTGAWITPGPRTEACSTPGTPPAPSFTAPTAPVLQLPATQVPFGLLISNEPYTLNCADVEGAGPLGPSVTVPAGTVQLSFSWTDIPNITDSQLSAIAAIPSGNLAPLADPSVTQDVIASVTGLPTTQAAYVLGQLQALQSQVTSLTLLSAKGTLNCWWENAYLSLPCPDPSNTPTNYNAAAIAAGVYNPAVVNAGTFLSYNSQAEADQLARTAALQQLTCLYGNSTMTVTCLDAGYVDPVPNDTVSITQDGRLRVGSVDVPAGVFFATTQAAADTAARNAALAQLVCFYTNALLTVTCGDISPSLAGAWTEPVDYDSHLPGNPVTVQQGRFIAEGPGSGQALADTTARNAALVQLDCRFKNSTQVVTCPSVNINGQVLAPQSTTSITVEAGTIEASSQDEADQLARQTGLLQLGCVYCNAFVPPSCYPASYTPAPGKAIPASDVTSDWSPDVVLGLAAGTVCLQDPTQVPGVATALAVQRPQVTDAGCEYLNDEMWFGCLPELPGSPALPKGGYNAPSYPSNTSLPPGYADLPFEQQLSPYSSPDPTLGVNSIIRIEAGAYPVNSNSVPAGMDPKAYANSQARLYGLSLLRCVFGNPLMNLNCQTAYAQPVGPLSFTQADVAQSQGEQVTISVPQALFESSTSFYDAWLAAVNYARASLDCHYENPAMLVRCWPLWGQTGQTPPLQTGTGVVPQLYGTGQARRTWTAGTAQYYSDVELQSWQMGSVQTPVTVPQGMFTSLLSLADATQQALNYAIASLDCTAQAQNNNVGNDPMLIFCGAVAEPNPSAPYAPGTNQILDVQWTVGDKGVIRAGDGHNRVMVAHGGAWAVEDLGCSTDPVGGCGGSGLPVPAGVAFAADKPTANQMAYLMYRGLLNCQSTVQPPGAGSGPAGPPGSSAPQTGCQGNCLAVYS
jgi:hypothetical protein